MCLQDGGKRAAAFLLYNREVVDAEGARSRYKILRRNLYQASLEAKFAFLDWVLDSVPLHRLPACLLCLHNWPAM